MGYYKITRLLSNHLLHYYLLFLLSLALNKQTNKQKPQPVFCLSSLTHEPRDERKEACTLRLPKNSSERGKGVTSLGRNPKSIRCCQMVRVNGCGHLSA